MRLIKYFNKLGYPNLIHALVVKKKSKVIEVQLPDDPEKYLRTIDRRSVEKIEEIEKEEPLKTK